MTTALNATRYEPNSRTRSFADKLGITDDLVHVWVLSFILTAAVWAPAALYIRIACICLTVGMLLLNIHRRVSSRLVIGYAIAMLALAALTLMVLDWQPGQFYLDIPDPFPENRKYDSSKYIPVEADLLISRMHLFQSLITAVLASLYLFGKPTGEKLFFAAVRNILTFNVAFWFFQFAVYHLLGIPIDLLSDGRYMADLFDTQFFRGPGIYNEPGTYACAVFPVLALHRLRVGRVDLLQILTVASLALSFSLFGWALGAAFCLVAIRWSVKKTLASIALVTAPVIVLLPRIVEYVTFRFNVPGKSHPSLDIKVYALRFWADQDVWRKITGNLGINDCKCLYNDSGTIFSLINEWGIVAAVFLAFMFASVRRSPRAALLLGAVLLTKVNLGQPVLALFLVGVYYLTRPAKSQETSCEAPNTAVKSEA